MAQRSLTAALLVAAALSGCKIVYEDENAVRVEVVDILEYLHVLDRDIRILKMDIEGAEWDILERLRTHPVLDQIDTIFVETHERQDPARFVPIFESLQVWAEGLDRPYINLYWV